MEQSLQKALVQQVFLQFQQYQLLNYLNLIYLCGPVIFIVLCDGGSSLVFFSRSSVVQLFNYQRNVFASYRCITRKCICSVVSVVQYFSVNTFFQSIIVQYSSICISVNVWGEQRWCVPLCPKMTVCELYRGEQVGASKNY